MQNWEDLEMACKACKRCALYESRTNVVFGQGNQKAEVLLIGEGPGEQEDLSGKPFVGRAGKLLDDMLEMINLKRSDIYIANTVKCRPPKNRDPLHLEKDACAPWLENQMALLKPKIIVCLGRISAMRIIDPEFKISREHGIWYEIFGVQVMAMYHPAALLRDPRRRPEAFEDLKKLQKMIQKICQNTYAPIGGEGEK